jgi:dienelactone hydrolase
MCRLALLYLALGGAPSDPETGRILCRPASNQNNIPERYRLQEHFFPYEFSRLRELPLSGVSVSQLRFPSPYKSPHPENNVVHAEYYRPRGDGPFPCAIVLDITAGDQRVSRAVATHLAGRGVAALCVQMAYYGPRRPPDSSIRFMSYDLKQTFDAVRQTVLDLRRATAWMESRPEIDKERLGIVGTSLGSFVAALTAEMEPKLKRVAVLLGGGGLVEAYYDHPRAKPYRDVFEALGGNKAMAVKTFAPVDPLTCAANLKDRRVLIVAAKRDEIVPPRAAEALWQATGRQKIVWYDTTHFGAAMYIASGLSHVTELFSAK